VRKMKLLLVDSITNFGTMKEMQLNRDVDMKLRQ